MVVIEKPLGDIIPVQLDFIDKVNATEVFTTAVVTAIDDEGMVNTAVYGTVAVSGNIVVVPVQAGDEGRQYWIDVTVTTDEGNIYTKQIHLLVRALPFLR